MNFNFQMDDDYYLGSLLGHVGNKNLIVFLKNTQKCI